MRGVSLIAVLIGLLIVGLLYMKRLNTVPQAARQALPAVEGVTPPKTLNEVPKAVEKQLNDTLQKAYEQQNRALEE